VIWLTWCLQSNHRGSNVLHVMILCGEVTNVSGKFMVWSSNFLAFTRHLVLLLLLSTFWTRHI
jgi:hypothetical protein